MSNAFHEIQFPPKIAYGASGGPEFSTTVVTSINGFEQRNINWLHGRGKWDVSTGIKNEQDISEVLAFFRAKHGKAYGFRFKDWSDYKAVEQMIGTGDGKEMKFRLCKHYKSGTHEYVRLISKPVAGSLKISVAGNYTLDSTTGIIIFAVPPAAGQEIICDFEFDVPARFDTDQIVVRAAGPGRFVVDSIPITEIRNI